MEAIWGMPWLLKVSAQASVLALLVLLAQWALAGRLSARAGYALWFLVLAKLLLPASLPSALSIYNYTRWSGLEAVQSPSPLHEVKPVSPPTPELPPETISAAPSSEMSAPPSVPTTAGLAETPARFWTERTLRTTGAIIWWIGVVFLCLRIFIQNILFFRSLRAAVLIENPDLVALLEECKILMSVSMRVRLFSTDAVKSPALYGIVRPRLLLPYRVLSDFSREELRDIFLHELAHIRRWDMAVHWLATALGVLHWFNPILWFAFRRMAADRETACDELALSAMTNQEPSRYGHTILKLLESSTPAALPGLLGIVEEKREMVQRIRRIANFKQRAAWSLAGVVLLLALGLATLTDAQTRKEDKLKTVFLTNALREGYLLFRVIDEAAQEPIPGVKVETRKTNTVTDGSGTVLLPLPEFTTGDFYYRIAISKDGYVAKFVSWSRYQKDDISDIPTEYTAKMSKGITIGGVVRNPAGEGIPKVKIIFSGPSPSGISDRERTTIMGSFHTERTDANGRWRCDHVPDRFESFTYELSHSEYVITEFSTENSTHVGLTRVPADSLRATNAVMILEPGIRILGVVVNEKHEPVKGAFLTQNYEWDTSVLTVTNESDGRFLIRNAKAGELTLTVQAPGFEPQIRTLAVTNPMPEVRMVMKRGHVLRGRVVDEAGQPTPGASLSYARVNFRPPIYRWSTNTDATGVFCGIQRLKEIIPTRFLRAAMPRIIPILWLPTARKRSSG